jgi:TPR repeat protein
MGRLIMTGIGRTIRHRLSLKRTEILRPLAVLAAFACAQPAFSEGERYALVIGNQDYAHVPGLSNARRDAETMAELLREFGFVVFDGYDVDRRAFETLLRQSFLNIAEGSDVIFFYAGHSIQIGRRNYLLPTDVAFESIHDLPVESITLDRVIDLLSSRGSAHLAIIDACRENPFPDVRLAADLDANLFETKTGFDVFQAPINSLIAFSTSPGMVAYDGLDGQNSPYTQALLNSARATPDTDAMAVFTEVRKSVYQATAGRQVPWESSTLVRPFHFSEGAESTAARGLTLALNETNDIDTNRTRATSEEVTDVTMPFDRRVRLSLADLGARWSDGIVDVATLAAPKAGHLAVETGDDGSLALIYGPDISEIRAVDLPGYGVEDKFRVELRRGDEAQAIEVNLQLEAHPCDIEAGDALDPQGTGLYRLPNEIEVNDAVAACVAGVTERPNDARMLYQLGRAEQAAGRLEDAFGHFRAAARDGHVRAKNAEAYLLFTNRIDRDLFDIPLDVEQANRLLDEGIAEGDPYAMHARGLRLLRDGETKADRERGFELMNRAAEMGHTYSMNELGVYFLTKDSDHYMPERGMAYLQASSDRSDIYGYHNLGFVALYGLDGQEPDYAGAFKHFVDAAEGGHPHSPATIGRMIMRGQVQGASRSDALKWYDMGLARGDGWGGANGATMILNGDVRGFDASAAAVRAAKAVHLSNAEATAAAREILGAQPDRVLAKAMQSVLVDLGEDIAVDGAPGQQTLAALERVATRNGLSATAASQLDRLLLATKAFWAERPTRPDLF